MSSSQVAQEGLSEPLTQTLCRERESTHLIQRAANESPLDSITWRKLTNINLTKPISHIYYFFLKGVDKKPYGSFSGPLKILSNVFAVPQAYPQACVMRTDVQRESPQTLQDFQSSNIQLCSLCSIY